jgi:hypothetical protein
MIEIPISFTVKGKDNLTADLFGLGEKVTDPLVLKMLGENARVANTEAEITEGVIIKRSKGKGKVEEAYVPAIEILTILGIATTGISLFDLAYKITDWIIDKTHDKEVEIKINGKKVTNKEEIKKLLEEILKGGN